MVCNKTIAVFDNNKSTLRLKTTDIELFGDDVANLAASIKALDLSGIKVYINSRGIRDEIRSVLSRIKYQVFMVPKIWKKLDIPPQVE